MGYFAYYFAWIALTFVLRYPPLAVGLVVLFLLRQFIPDPFVLFRTMGRTRALTRQIEANPANVTARRDLAMVYIDRLRPGRALALLEEARKRFPDDAELLYLSGLAHAKRGDAAEAVPLLVRAVQIDPRVRFGEPYLVAGDALRKLGRTDDALDAFERFVGVLAVVSLDFLSPDCFASSFTVTLLWAAAPLYLVQRARVTLAADGTGNIHLPPTEV